MPFCIKCGVEVEKYITQCPLCNAEITEKKHDIKTGPGIYPDRIQEPEGLSLQEKQKLIREIMIFSSILSAIIVVIIDFIISHTIAWSRYVVLSLFLFTILANGLFYIRKHVLLVILSDIISVTGSLFLLDYFDGKIDWFLIIGLPLILLLTFVIVSLIIYIKRTHTYGLNIPAVFLISIIFSCIGIDICVIYYQTQSFYLTWSLIVSISSIVPAALMFFIHYRIKKIDLNKVFHI